MRVLFPVFLIVFIVLFAGCDVNDGPDEYKSDDSSWERISEYKMDGLVDAHFISATTGYVVGNDGFMAKTEDAGDTWLHIETPAEELALMTVYMKNDGSGFVAGRRGVIYYTTDDCANWTDKTNPLNAEIDFIENFFLDSNNGYLLANDGSLFRTSDAGNSWTELGVVSEVSPIKDIFFLDMDKGFAVGAGGNRVKTINGGVSWQPMTFTSADSLSNLAVWFFDEDNGVIAGQYRMHRRTTDGGETWLSITFPDIGNDDAVLELFFLDESIGFATTQDGAIYKTENAGENWVEKTSTIQGPINDVCFFDESFGWIVGDDPIAGTGAFKITNDIGENWEYRSFGIGADVMGVSFYDMNTGWAVGNGGYIYRTTDGGDLWLHQESPVALDLEDVDFTDELNGIAVGHGQRIVRTDNGGETWERITGDWDDSWFQVIEYYSDELAFVSGTNGVFLRSVDAGLTWETITLPMLATYNDIQFISATEGYAVGDNGVLIHSTDAGLTWDLIETPTLKSFKTIDVVGANSLWLAGGNVVLHSPDGGISWENFEEFLSGNYMMGTYTSIAFFNNDKGWVVGNFGYRIHTVDGGKTWYRQNSPNIIDDLKEICPIGTDAAYAVGMNGMVLKLNP